jgi:hypothetical protein
LEYEPGGSAEISGDALHITTGSASEDGAKVFRPLPSQTNLKVSGTVRFLTSFSRIWVLVRADGTESLRNGYGFSWRFTGFADNTLILFDNTTDDLNVGGFKSVDVQHGWSLGQTINFEMLILGDNSLAVRVWAQGTERPLEPTLESGPMTPLASGSNLAIVESTRDFTNGDFFIDDVSVSALPPSTPAISITPDLLFTLGAPLDFLAPGDNYFDVTNVGGGLLHVSEKITLPTGSPFNVILGTALELAAGQTGRVTVRFSPKDADVYRAQLFLQTNDPSNSIVTINLAGEKFVNCAGVSIETVPSWKVSSCYLFARLRDSRYMAIERFDPTTKLFVSNTELFRHAERHADELKAITLQVDYGTEIREFIFNGVCMSNEGKFLDAIKLADDILDFYGTIADIIAFFQAPESFTVSGLAVDLAFLQVRLGAKLADAVYCKGPQIQAFSKKGILNFYIGARGYADPEAAFQAAIPEQVLEDPVLYGLFKAFGIKNVMVPEGLDILKRYLEFAFKSYELADPGSSVELRQAIGRGIAECAFQEERDVLLGLVPTCGPGA